MPTLSILDIDIGVSETPYKNECEKPNDFGVFRLLNQGVRKLQFFDTTSIAGGR
jgi:hypothetical protein